MKTKVFRDPVSAKEGIGAWRLRLDGVVLPHNWNSKGAALAAIPVERARAARCAAFTADARKLLE
jgi:hypothetical protein